VERLIGALGDVPDLHLTLAPRGVVALRPPADHAPEQALDVEPRSPIEIFLGGLQSIGSWRAFLGYAVAAGVVVWIALFTETIYLLTAAMLISPFAGPAMNAALATARGDALLFGRAIGRYFAALAVAILTAFLLSIAMRQDIATELMIEMSFMPSVAVLLPLVAGAAGALNLCQSERSSLVSGAATGMLVAASLAPPAGIIGMAAAIREWEMVLSGVWVLLLQIAGINVAGAIVFRLHGLRPAGIRFARGKPRNAAFAWIGTLAVMAGLVGYQFSSSPELQRSTVAQRAVADARAALRESGLGIPVQVRAEFTRADIEGQNSLLVTAFVQGSGPAEPLEQAVKERLRERYDAVPLVDVVMLEP
jgi:uncharacterized membrane protein